MEFLQRNARAVIIALLAVGVITAVSLSGNDTETVPNEPETSEDVVVLEDKQPSESSEKEQKVEKSEGQLTVSAVSGDSQTVLARKVVAAYTEESGDSLSPEQALYVETNLVGELGRQDLIFVGDTVRLSEETVKSTVDASKNLTESQIALWAQYL